MTIAEDKVQAEPTGGSRIGRAIGWFFKSLLRLVVFVILIAILVAGAWIGYQELNRSFASVRQGAEINEDRIELLRSDMQAVMETLPEHDAQLRDVDSSLGAVDTRLDGVDERLIGVEDRLADDLAHQAEVLTALETEINNLIADSESIHEHMATMDGDLATVQDGLMTTGTAIADLEGDIAGVESSLAEEAARLEGEIVDPAGQLADMQQLLILFRSWELVSRARLHLIQGNGGLAIADLSVAVDTLDVLVAGNDSPTADRLLVARQRMLLAIDSLPDDPVTASRDLESAWEAIDGVLGSLLGLEIEPEIAPTEEAPEEGEETEP